jgi:hypothetical protein
MPGTSVLESQGATLQTFFPLHEQEQRLKRYQEEMQAFAAFLKTTFFQESDVSQ